MILKKKVWISKLQLKRPGFEYQMKYEWIEQLLISRVAVLVVLKRMVESKRCDQRLREAPPPH